MSEPITTEIIHEDIPVDASKNLEDTDVKPAVIDNNGTNTKGKSYDPVKLDSVVDVVTDADPIGKICRDAGMTDPAETSKTKSKNHANPKKAARKRRASNLITIICVISMLAVVIVFAQAVELAHLDLGDMYGKLVATCTGVSVLFHMWAHGYIIRAIK